MRNRRGQRSRVLPTFKQNTKLTKPDPATWPPVRVDDLTMSPVDPPEDAEEGFFRSKLVSPLLTIMLFC